NGPIQGATITSGSSTATTNPDGTFTIANVPLGASLQVTAPGWIGTTYNNVGTTNGSIGTIPLVTSTTTTSATFSGHFVDATTRNHIPSVSVSVRTGVNTTSRGSIVQQFTTDTTGGYSLQLAPGTYTVLGRANGYIPVSVTVPADAGANVTNFDVVVP